MYADGVDGLELLLGDPLDSNDNWFNRVEDVTLETGLDRNGELSL